MLYFLIGAALGFWLPKLGWYLVASGAHALRPRRAIDGTVRRLAPLAALLLLIALLFLMGDWSFLESARNMRLTFGAVFGWLIGALTSETGGHSLSRGPDAPAGLSDHAPAIISPGGEAAGKGPWWVRPSSLIVIAVIVLPLFAAIAPHGELDLGFLRSVKTQFLEAQFAQNEVEFRLELKNEPQGFFNLGADGMGDALHMARNEAILRNRIVSDIYSPEYIASPDYAFLFITEVLQPAALCAHEIDLIYGDQEVLVSALRIIGTGLSRALALSANALKQGQQQRTKEAAEESVRQALMVSFERFDTEKK